MKTLIMPLLAGALLLVPAPMRADELLKLDGAATARDITKDRIAGEITPPFRDDSSWAPVDARYSALSENGQKFQRIEVLKIESGRAQMAADLPPSAPDKIYSLQMRLRGTEELPLTFGVRDQSAPYTFHWQDNALIKSQWQNYKALFRLPADGKPIGFWFLINGTGTLDVADFKLEEVGRDELVKRLRAQSSDDVSGNLAPVSRFPLGLPSGSWLNPQGSSPTSESEPRAFTDNTIKAPSGSAPLRVDAEQPFELYLPPFGIPVPFEDHVASINLRGNGTATLRVTADGAEIKRADVDLGDDWKRHNLVFAPDLTKGNYALRVDAKSGPLWLDGLQVERGTAPTALNKRAEIALSVPSPSQAAGVLNTIQFADEPALVDWLASDAPAGATLRASVFNIYGEEQALAPVKLKAGATRGNWKVDVFPARPLGVFRVEAHIVGADGKNIGPTREVIVNRMRRPRAWGVDAPDSPFGVHMTATAQNIANAKAVGINWTRLHDTGLDLIGWKYLEPQPGQWKFRDAEIRRFRDGHIKILGELSTAPEWASYQKGSAREGQNGYWDQFFQPRDLNDYANYVSRVTSRYKGVIDVYEVWNEPWISEWWPVGYDAEAGKLNMRSGYRTSANPQRDYANLMKSAFEATKKVDPKIKIVGFNASTLSETSNSRIRGSEWVQGVLDNGGLNYADVISYHNYSVPDNAFPDDNVTMGDKEVLDPIRAINAGVVPRPVWMTEGSPVNNLSNINGFYRQTLPTTNNDSNTQSADALARFTVSLLANGTDKLFLYSMGGHQFFGGSNTWSLLNNADNTLNPMGAAYSNLTWHLEGLKFSSRREVAPGVFAFVFSDGKRSVAAIARHGEGNYKVPANVEAVDLWGNPLAAGADVGATLVYLSSEGDASGLVAKLG